MSTIEGGMVCTNSSEIYEMARMYRSHGLVRESTDKDLKDKYASEYPELNQDFIFAFPAYNVRNTEIGAILGRSQLNNTSIIRSISSPKASRRSLTFSTFSAITAGPS